MIILSDIIMQYGYTSDDIIIKGLAHYWDIDADTLGELDMYLRTNAAVTPYVIILDHSDEKKDSALLFLRTSCDKINTSMRFEVNPNNLIPSSSLDKCLLETYVEPIMNDFTLACEADMIAYSICTPAEPALLVLKTDVSDDIHTEVDIFPMSCKLMELDDKFLYELDPFLLSELDYYGIGARLVSEADIHYEVLINDMEEQTAQLQAMSVDMEVSPPLSYYDEYLLMHFDKYVLSEMDAKIIL